MVTGKQKKKKKSALDWENSFPARESSERALVAALVYNSALFHKIAADLQPEDFHQETIRFIFSILKEFHANGTAWTTSVITDAIIQHPQKPAELDFPGTYIMDLMPEKAEEDTVEFHVRQLANLRMRREVVSNLFFLEEAIKDPTKNEMDFLALLKKLEQTVTYDGAICLVKEIHGDNIVSEFFAEADRISGRNFVGTGFPSIDKHLTWGFFPGQLSIISGRPSSGKSSLRTNIMANLAEMGIPTMAIIREQDYFAELARLIAVKDSQPVKLCARAFDWGEIEGFRDFLRDRIQYIQDNWPIWIVQPKGGIFNLCDIKTHIRRAQAEGKHPRVVFVDLFAQLDDVNVAENQANKITKKVIEAANMAMEMDVHICLVVQQRRMGNVSGKQREEYDKREGLKGSGGYEERADTIFYVERPAYFDKEQEDSLINVAIIKQRDGATPMVQLTFNSECIKIQDDLHSQPDWKAEDINNTSPIDYLMGEDENKGSKDHDEERQPGRNEVTEPVDQSNGRG